jgi:hypothetical protein
MRTDATRPEPAGPARPSKESPARPNSSPPFSEVLSATQAPAQTAGEPGAASGAAFSAGDGAASLGDPGAQALLGDRGAVFLSGFREALGRRAAAGRSASHPSPGDPLDPAARQSAQLGPPLGASAPRAQEAPVEACARVSLEEVLPALVRRIAWSGDGRKGSLRLEFGAGALAGGTLVVHSDEGRVRVELNAPTGADAAAWRERIVSRLEARRLPVEDVDVR